MTNTSKKELELRQVQRAYEQINNGYKTYKVKEIIEFLVINGLVVVFDKFDIENKVDIIEHLKANKKACFYAPQLNTILREIDYCELKDIEKIDNKKKYTPLTKQDKEKIIKYLESL